MTQIYEVVAAGFDASTDETDNRVHWVSAVDRAQVIEAIRDTGASIADVLGASFLDIDFALPGEALQLQTALLEWASVERNRHR